MRFKNSTEGFGLVNIALHWFMALLIIALLCIGLYMVRIPISGLKLKLFKWHKEFGMLVLMLAFVRLGWRLSNISPTFAALAHWEILAARAAHWMLYGLMFLMPFSGWLLSSSAGIPVSFFGLFILPDLVSPSEPLRHFLTQSHEWMAYALIAVLGGHTGAALKHHFINKDAILRRMIWP